MKKFLTSGRARFVVAATLLLFALFCISAAVFGAWWRFENMPTAEEWQALFGATVLVALALTWYQIRQVDSSNLELVRANELSRQANLEISRPRVQVYLQMDRQVLKSRGQSVQGTMYLAIRNTGQSPALNVKLQVDVPFSSSEEFFMPGRMQPHFEEVNAVFDGTVRFPVMSKDAPYVWLMGRVPRIFDEVAGVPRRYEVTASYDSSAGESYVEKMPLDLDIEKRIELPVPPLVRIGKDIEVVGDHLKSISSLVAAASRSATPTPAAQSPLRHRRPRIRRSR
ncbi:hypothetical protein [Microbacterium sp. NPDC058389]|uniref:hypothetical protein n=1 Tax=Microbacterium sp. NPDC058389 TaxID=3346475 RepID=UPI00364FF2D8